MDIQPSFQTRNEPLEYSTIEDYIRKANILNLFFKEKDLSQPVKRELKKLLNDNPNINERLILDEMDYLEKDVEETINKLRNKYKNDNSFKSYINILSVISSHFKTLKDNYQIFTKLGKVTNMKVQEKREDNELDETEQGKIISLNKTEVLINIEKLESVDDKLLYGLYTLTPSRRLDYRTMIITNETDTSN